MVESSLNQGFGSPQMEEKWRGKQPTNEGGRVSSVCVGASAHMERARQAPRVVKGTRQVNWHSQTHNLADVLKRSKKKLKT